MSQDVNETSRCKSHMRCTCAEWRDCCICRERAWAADRAQAEAPDGLQLDLGVLDLQDDDEPGKG